MKLKKIILNNIRSYSYQEVTFPEGSILLSGDVGSGKTSVLLGIEFALFGLQPGHKGSALLRNGTDEGSVMIEFELEDKTVVVERTLKRGKTISQGSCSITIEGKKEEIAVTELKTKILDLLNYPKEFSRKQNLLYKFTVYTPQEEMKEIITQDAETRINTLRHVFGIDRYKRILENVSIITARIRSERRLKEGITLSLEQDKLDLVSKEEDLESKYYNLTSIEKELFLKRENRQKIQEERENLSKKVEEKNKLQQELEKTRLVISNKENSIADNQKLIRQLREQISELETLKFEESELIELEKEINSKRNEREILNQKNLEVNSQIASLNARNEDNLKLEMKISNLEICPTCLQNVDAVYRANVLNKAHSEKVGNNKMMENLREEKKKVEEKITKINSEIYSNEKETNEFNLIKIRLQGIDEKQARINDIENINIVFGKDNEILREHIKTLENSLFELKKFDSVFESKTNQLEEALKEEKMAEIKVAELKREIEVFSRQVEELRERTKKAVEIKKQLDYLTGLENWLSKKFSPVISMIERNVMIKLKSEFSKSFNEWFNMLVSDSFNVQLQDDFTPVIEYQDYEIDYAYLSGGERTAIALAYRLSLNQVINSLLSKIKTRELVILDEPTDGFSEQQLDKMRGVFEQLNVNQLIIVSHEQRIEDFVENVIKFKKEQGITQIVS